MPQRNPLLLTLLLATASSAWAGNPPASGAPKGGEEVPCAPVKPCEIPDDAFAPAAEAPADFGPQVKQLFALVSCQGAPPVGYDAKVVQAFCARQTRGLTAYRDGYLPQASAQLARARPAGLPTAVVHAFGDGDLISALTTFPDARNVTTLAQQGAGDVRKVQQLQDPRKLAAALDVVRTATQAILAGATPGAAAQRDDVPVELALSLTALAVHGYEPVGLRYFRVEPDGSLHYLTAAELGASGAKPSSAPAPGASSAFASAELTFVKKGEDPSKARIHRHLAADLTDAGLAKVPGVLEHLRKKGKFTALTQGGALWRDDARKLREVVLAGAVLVVSEPGGFPPAIAAQAGFTQETYQAPGLPGVLASRKASPAAGR